VELPDLYSGLLYFYQPLLHLVGAAWIALFGDGTLLGLPVALTAALFATLATGGLGAGPGRPGRWAAVLVLALPAVAGMAVRLYVEPLSTLLAVWVVALLHRAWRSERLGPAVALGVVAGLGALAKFNGWMAVFGIVLAAAYGAATGRRRQAERMGLAAGIALLLGLPWHLRSQFLFGSALYPAFAPDLDRELFALNRAMFSTPPAAFLAALPGILGAGGALLAAAAIAAAAIRRRWTLRESAMVGAIAAMVAIAFIPFAGARHLGPFLAVLVWMSAWAVAEWVAPHPLARLGVALAVLAIGVHAVVVMPDHRRLVDPPAFLSEAMPHVAANTPPEAVVLSLWTYDTWYHAGRAATWPIPWGQRTRPLEALRQGEPDSILARLSADGITHVLSPAVARPGAFNSSNYPEAFVLGLAALERKGAARIAWRSDDLVLVALSPPGAESDTLPSEPSTPRRLE